ncbi:MAG: glycosyltransferase family 2 protein [Actinomycetia bacterium]|nr:glycosyltransferase family 2 protein [Actinomycetes bacterium]
MRTTVVIVHRRQAQRCVATVAAFSAQQGVEPDMVVVDNGSPVTDLDLVRDRCPRTHLMELGANTGFGPAANVGLAAWLASRADQEWVFLAPHDVEPAPDALARLIEVGQESDDVGLISADVGDRSRQVFDPYFGGMTVARDATETDPVLDVDYPHGTLLGARRACLADIGLFDERYFAYCEEADLGARARAHGWRVVLATGVGVRNLSVSPGTPAIDYLQQRNTIQLVARHSGLYHASIRWLIAVGQLVRGVVDPSARGYIFHPAARVRALFDVVRGRTGPPPVGMVSGGAGGAAA